MRTSRRAALAAAVLVLVTGCSAAPPHHGQPTPGPTAAAAPSGPASGGSPAGLPAAAPSEAVTKLLVVVEENHSLAQMRSGMPYTLSLAKRFGYATDYHAITHPSLPNYIAIAGGATYGIADDSDPSSHRLTGHSVFGQALAHHRTAEVYLQSMPAPCATTSSDPYAVKHNPWAYFVRERRQCLAHDVPMERFGHDVAAGALPQVGMVVPNLQNDAHDGTLQQADDWFRSLMSRVFAGPDWRSGHLAVVLTADEDDGSQDNTVLTVVVHPSQHHHVVHQRLDHYSLTRLYDEVAKLPYLGHAATAPSMATAFGLPLP